MRVTVEALPLSDSNCTKLLVDLTIERRKAVSAL
jgi:hypothetical protein